MRRHEPVLLREAVALLNCKSEGLYVDCTLGMGGHTESILEHTSPSGRVVAFDRDIEAIRFAETRLGRYQERLKMMHADYRTLKQVWETNSFPPANGILADLGPSMLQFTTTERGFSFQSNGPLDMRMDRSQAGTAEQIVNRSSISELTVILRNFGEEKFAGRIARAIVRERQTSPVQTTEQLRQIVEQAIPRNREKGIHPATKTFQALRIAVNKELENLDLFVFDAFDTLATGGRLVIIAFHSLEDRVIKQTFRFLSAACRCPKRFLQCICGGKPLSKLLTRKAVRPEREEIDRNPASRSARLRAIEKRSGPVPRELWPEWQRERN